MDGSVLFDPQYLPIIIATLVGFGLLAAALLVPVYRFLERERKVSEEWTPDKIAGHIEKVRRERAQQEDDEEKDKETPEPDASPS